MKLDYKRALEWYTLAAEQGHAHALMYAKSKKMVKVSNELINGNKKTSKENDK